MDLTGDVTKTPCPLCGALKLRIEYRLIERQFGTWSLAGVQDKRVMVDWPHLTCDGCLVLKPATEDEHGRTHLEITGRKQQMTYRTA